MLKRLKQLRAICKWIIFLEVLFFVGSLNGALNVYLHWKVLLSVLYYASVSILFIVLRKKLAFKQMDEASVQLLNPSDILPNNLLVFLTILFAVEYLPTTYMIVTEGYYHIYSLIETINYGHVDLGWVYLKFLTLFLMPLGIAVSGSLFFIRLFRFMGFSKEKATGNRMESTQTETNNIEKNKLAAFDNVLPFIIQADLQDEAGPFIYNPYGNGKLLKKMTGDLACTFIVTTAAGEPLIIDKGFITANNISEEDVAAKAEQNLLKLYQQQRQVVKREMGSNSTLYSIELNNRNEPSVLFAKNIWTLLSAQHKDHLVVSVPKYNEIHYCTLKGNAVPDLINLTISTWKNAGTEALSPNVYLFHNGSWIMFNEGPEQVFNYCVEHKLITLNFNL